MGLVTLSQAEGASEVASQQVHLLDVGDQGLVDGLLVGSTAAVDLLLLWGHKVSHQRNKKNPVSKKSYLGLLSLLEEGLLAGLLLGLLGGEVLGLRDLLDLLLIEARDVDLVGSGDDVSGVDSAEGNTVDLEGAGDEEDALVKGLQEDDTLATETASEEDEDSAGLEGLAGSPRSDGLADL